MVLCFVRLPPTRRPGALEAAPKSSASSGFSTEDFSLRIFPCTRMKSLMSQFTFLFLLELCQRSMIGMQISRQRRVVFFFYLVLPHVVQMLGLRVVTKCRKLCLHTALLPAGADIFRGASHGVGFPIYFATSVCLFPPLPLPIHPHSFAFHSSVPRSSRPTDTVALNHWPTRAQALTQSFAGQSISLKQCMAPPTCHGGPS